ncbi:MAG: ATP-binding protein [Verrucomicrobiota bacterium]
MLLTTRAERVPVVTSGRRVESSEGARYQLIFLTVHQRRKYEDEILQAKEAAETALRSNEELRHTRESLATHAKELERKVRAAIANNDDLRRLTQVLSHDLREPIRKIGLFADLVREHLAPAIDAEAVEGLRKVDSEAAHIERVINAVRQYLQLDATPPLENVELQPLVEEAARTVSMKLKFNDWIVTCDPLPALTGRRAQLLQLFIQLLENAVKFREPSRRLRVCVRGRTVKHNAFTATQHQYDYVDFVQLEVEDNGSGFDPKYRDYAFEFMKKVRLDSTGLGIGLAICRKIVGLHFGSIQVETAPGTGATFTVRLPVAH